MDAIKQQAKTRALKKYEAAPAPHANHGGEPTVHIGKVPIVLVNAFFEFRVAVR
jgi:hypothetical protein